jgi:ABC-type sugar transport system permease subunit
MKKVKKKSSYEQKKQRAYLVFMLPFLIGFFLLFLGIYLNSLGFSFSNIKMVGAEGYTQKFVGFDNFKYAFLTDPHFVNNLRSSMVSMLRDVVMGTLFSLMIAVVLNGNMKGRTAFRAIFFVPVILPTGFVDKADEFTSIFSSQWSSMGETATNVANGLISSKEISDILMELSFSEELSDIVISAVDGIFNIVNISGVPILIFLAGLQSISPAIYEAADIDGTSKWESFWLITFPMISPIILVNVIYIVVDSMTSSSNVIMTQIRELSFSSSMMGVASAMAWIYFVLNAIVIGLFFFVISRYVYYQQKE